MKLLKLFLVLLIGVTCQNMNAQYGYGSNGMYGGGMGMGGMNRMRNQQSIQNTNDYGRNSKSAEDIEKERAENINKTMDKLTKELTLDDLQVIVIRKEIEASSKSIYAVMKSESPEEQKIKEIEAINEKTDRTINTFLNPTQKEKYKNMIQERMDRMEKYKLSKK
ncbi:hypothetical protein [Flavobacterium aciduliphilum]|uniref:Spy/CpxP family protein refolding chaperone n=1 Tax=Flavobacterium aciduliphilum TaxID=1101402 RepID=A0A328YC96_9FLAO|nr:hypothetical protein [Flavobacterium aciduliphilum]RAR70844.1 hypothetical protein CLV55_10998 [Flavobacterium aciduliphilum]